MLVSAVCDMLVSAVCGRLVVIRVTVRLVTRVCGFSNILCCVIDLLSSVQIDLERECFKGQAYTYHQNFYYMLQAALRPVPCIHPGGSHRTRSSHSLGDQNDPLNTYQAAPVGALTCC